jgi:hypothetical protein
MEVILAARCELWASLAGSFAVPGKQPSIHTAQEAGCYAETSCLCEFYIVLTSVCKTDMKYSPHPSTTKT